MNCQNFEEKLSAYLDGELDYGAREEVERHLVECPECSRVLEEMRRIESFKPLLEPPGLPREKWRECWEEVKKQTTDSLSAQQVRERVSKRRRAHYLRRAIYGLAGVAAAVVVVAVLLWPAAPPEEDTDPVMEESVCVLDYDDANYNLHIIDDPRFTIIKLVPVENREGG